MKAFVQILMAVLALGTYAPQPVCASGTSEAGKICCCTGSPVCKCHSDKPCKQSCALVKAQAFDKQIPARIVRTASPQSNALLYSISPTKVKDLDLASVSLDGNGMPRRHSVAVRLKPGFASGSSKSPSINCRFSRLKAAGRLCSNRFLEVGPCLSFSNFKISQEVRH